MNLLRPNLMLRVEDRSIRTCFLCGLRCLGDCEFLNHHMTAHNPSNGMSLPFTEPYTPTGANKINFNDGLQPLKMLSEFCSILAPETVNQQHPNRVFSVRQNHEGENLLRMNHSEDEKSRKQMDESSLPESLSRKKGVYSSNSKYKCDLCGQTFTQAGNMRRHLSTLHAEVKKEVACSICGKKFVSAGNKKRHEASHFNEVSFPCKICNKKFGQASNMRRHLYLVHGN